MDQELSPESIRVLGVLLEKEQTVPDSYPLTLNSIVLGCNQTTNREPVVQYDEMTVERALTQLRETGLSLRGVYAGSRVPKHRHNIEDVFHLSQQAKAVLTVLLLRGDQTLGEIKQRTERMYQFESLAAVDSAIDELVQNETPLADRLGKIPGQKEGRVGHLLGSHSDKTEVSEKTDRPSLQLIEGEREDDEESEYYFDSDDEIESRVERLEKEVTVLTHEIMSLRAEIDAMRDPSA